MIELVTKNVVKLCFVRNCIICGSEISKSTIQLTGFNIIRVRIAGQYGIQLEFIRSGQKRGLFLQYNFTYLYI